MQECKLYVGNLNYSVTEEQIKELFAQHGEVKDVIVIKDKMTGRSKGFGFVELSNESEVQHAIDGLNNSEFMGRMLRINRARARSENPNFKKRPQG